MGMFDRREHEGVSDAARLGGENPTTAGDVPICVCGHGKLAHYDPAYAIGPCAVIGCTCQAYRDPALEARGLAE